jgi:hypothetical protein
MFGYKIVKERASEVEELTVPYDRFLELNKSYQKLEVEAGKAKALAEIKKREADRYKAILLAIQTLSSTDSQEGR